MEWLQSLAAELVFTTTNGTFWLSMGQGLLVGALCLVFGVSVARFVGLLGADAPAGETIGVGLASGVLVIAAWWAAIASSGRSAFTPVAVGFAIAIVLAVARRVRSRRDVDAEPPAATAPDSPEPPESRSARRRHLAIAVIGSAVFVVAVALLYGSTLTLSPRDGVQPLEFHDTAFYSILGADLARTGTETIYSPSGFAALEGLPAQTWYHWGELWLGSALITIFGMSPLAARHFVVLPLLLLAAAALTGTVVRRLTGASSRGAFLFGFLACLFLAPVPLAVGLLFGITSYGLAAGAALLAIYGFAVLGRRPATWGLTCFVGSAVALILPAHLVIALLGLVGLGTVWALRIGRSLASTRRLPPVAPIWRRTYVVTGIAIVATVAWGWLTGHGLGGSWTSTSVEPFNAFWRESVAIVSLSGITFLAIVVAWFLVRKESSVEADLYRGTIVLLVFGALVWGVRVADFITAHLFYAGIAAFATPAAAVAVWSIYRRARADGRARLAIVVVVLCIAQLEAGATFSIGRLALYGPGDHPRVPVEIVAEIEALPADAKLAYPCGPTEETAFWIPHLVALDAQTGRRIVPMCFQSETLGLMIGAAISPDVPNPLFELAPQRELYPDSSSRPSVVNVASFLKANGIEYIYADATHPNTLAPAAIPIATSGQTQILRIP